MSALTSEQLEVVKKCIELCELVAEDVDNGNVFVHDKELLRRYNQYFGTGPLECAKLIRTHFNIDSGEAR